MFHVDLSRGSVVLENILGKDFTGKISCDFLGAYRKFERLSATELLFCWAHLIREVRFLAESKDKKIFRYGNRLLTAIGEMFSTCEERGESVLSFLQHCLESLICGLSPSSLPIH